MVKRASLRVMVLLLALAPIAHASAPTVQEGLSRVTLYAPNKYGLDSGKTLYSFKTGAYVRDLNLWDINYGSLYVGDEWDWFSASTAEDARSVIRDLGELGWGDYFEVPVLRPFPKLKKGQTRTFTVDASGADGADGAPGAPADGQAGPPAAAAPAASRTEKRSGVPKVDPVFAKALPGHMYVMRVVGQESDFYVLFRVEAIERGDNCTITWKRVPPPEETARNK
jgi:hypothetical protein